MSVRAMMTDKDADDLMKAARILHGLHIGDFIYHIRERESVMKELKEGQSSWEAPSVKAYSDACVILGNMVQKYPERT